MTANRRIRSAVVNLIDANAFKAPREGNRGLERLDLACRRSWPGARLIPVDAENPEWPNAEHLGCGSGRGMAAGLLPRQGWPARRKRCVPGIGGPYVAVRID